jgi:hypothetical protein
VGGSALSWFLFALNMSLLFFVSFTVMSLGGFCASGGPYVIEVECPENVAAFAPLSVFGGLFAVAISLLLAQGFGFPLIVWAWPILFGSLGGVFLVSFFAVGDLTGLVIGALFLVMALAPLVLELRASPQRTILGTVDANGARFQEGDRARRSMMSTGEPNPEGAVRPTSLHWATSLVLAIVPAWAGYFLARLWFFGG